MTVRVIQFAEDDLAATISRDLLDRAVHEEADESWLRDLWAPDTRDSQRRFTDLDGAEGVYTVRGPVAAHRFHPHSRDLGTSNGLPGNAGLTYKFARLAALARRHDEEVLLLVAFDTDHKDKAERCRRGVEVAASSVEEPIPAVVAEASPEFDAWVLAGCDVSAAPLRDRHAGVCERLRGAGHAIDPVQQPHRLRSKNNTDPLDAKRLCAEILGIDRQAGPEHPAAQRCWIETAIDLLRKNGHQAGVAAFLSDVRREVPRCYPGPRRR